MVEMKGQNGKIYDYPDKTMVNAMVDKVIAKDFSEVCKEQNIHRGKLMEDFMRKIVLRFKTGSLNQDTAYVTMDVLAFRKHG